MQESWNIRPTARPCSVRKSHAWPGKWDFAELWELDAGGKRVLRHASWDAMPLSVAQDSVTGKVSASLVDIGAGTADSDYAGKSLGGRLRIDQQPAWSRG